MHPLLIIVGTLLCLWTASAWVVTPPLLLARRASRLRSTAASSEHALLQKQYDSTKIRNFSVIAHIGTLLQSGCCLFVCLCCRLFLYVS